MASFVGNPANVTKKLEEYCDFEISFSIVSVNAIENDSVVIIDNEMTKVSKNLVLSRPYLFYI